MYARFFQFAEILSKFFIYLSFPGKLTKRKWKLYTMIADIANKNIFYANILSNCICYYHNQTVI